MERATWLLEMPSRLVTEGRATHAFRSIRFKVTSLGAAVFVALSEDCVELKVLGGGNPVVHDPLDSRFTEWPLRQVLVLPSNGATNPNTLSKFNLAVTWASVTDNSNTRVIF